VPAAFRRPARGPARRMIRLPGIAALWREAGSARRARRDFSCPSIDLYGRCWPVARAEAKMYWQRPNSSGILKPAERHVRLHVSYITTDPRLSAKKIRTRATRLVAFVGAAVLGAALVADIFGAQDLHYVLLSAIIIVGVFGLIVSLVRDRMLKVREVRYLFGQICEIHDTLPVGQHTVDGINAHSIMVSSSDSSTVSRNQYKDCLEGPITCEQSRS